MTYKTKLVVVLVVGRLRKITLDNSHLEHHFQFGQLQFHPLRKTVFKAIDLDIKHIDDQHANSNPTESPSSPSSPSGYLDGVKDNGSTALASRFERPDDDNTVEPKHSKRRHQNRPQDPRRGGVGIFRNENDGRRHGLRSHADRFEPRQECGVGRRSTIHAAVQWDGFQWTDVHSIRQSLGEEEEECLKKRDADLIFSCRHTFPFATLKVFVMNKTCCYRLKKWCGRLRTISWWGQLRLRDIPCVTPLAWHPARDFFKGGAYGKRGLWRYQNRMAW